MFNTGWGFKDVLPYYIKSEDQQDFHLAKDKYRHGVRGPQPVSYPKYRSTLVGAFLSAAKFLGFPVLAETRNDELEGFSFPQAYMKHGERWSSAR